MGESKNSKNNTISLLENSIKEKLTELKALMKQELDYSKLDQEIWKLSKQKFKLEARSTKKFQKYQGLIFTIGFSPEPIVLNILANEPESVYFIYTKESEVILNEIIDETQLKPSYYRRGRMERISAADSYNQVKRGIQFLSEEKAIPIERIALDPTGGTKIMSVGCGIAASIFNLDILYVNNRKYNPEIRRPEPGSEVLVSIPNPFDIYQDDKILEGLKYLETLNFAHAREIFYKISRTSTNPLFAKLLALISDMLYQWDMINYHEALSSIGKIIKLINQIEQNISKIKDDVISVLEKWENYLEIIIEYINKGKREVEKISPLLIYDIKKNADREFEKGIYNNASLKYYRTIEMINQYILFTQFNINTQEPEYDNVPEEYKNELIKKDSTPKKDAIQEIILKKYNILWKDIYEKTNILGEYKEREILPRRIGLIAGVIMRYILGDPNINKDLVFRIHATAEQRNNSIFAHGIESVDKKTCKKLKKVCVTIMKSIQIDSNLKKAVFDTYEIAKLTDYIIKVL
ncbi:MAG: TIGR02710 family CRISPR-associated protein [Candidatus Lokiarchaeota archaeon]|nr:TIGR02710 family CRISPR-associated protein [Candidatus Lokiarchaeota archaeon]